MLSGAVGGVREDGCRKTQIAKAGSGCPVSDKRPDILTRLAITEFFIIFVIVMAETKNNIWEQAGKAGLVLGGISIAYMLLTMLTGKVAENGPTVLMGLVNFLLWAAKLGACIYLMRFFILRFAMRDPSVDSSRAFRFGTLTALLSALLYSAFYLAYVSFIAPDTFEQALSIFEDNPMMDSNSMAAIEEMIPRMPTISFFVNLVWCWLFGTVLSAIFSRNVSSKNPFIDEQ